MKAKFAVYLLLVALLVSACSPAQEAPAEAVTVRVMAMKGPTGMGMAYLMDQAEKQAGTNAYECSLVPTADLITPKLAQGEVDIAAVPANLASVLYNNTDKSVQVIAINTLGVLYIVESGESVHSVEDLRGKTIYSSGKGTTPEYTLNYILRSNGIDPQKDVTIEWKTEQTENLTALMSKENTIALLPEPFVTIAQEKSDQIRVAFGLNEEWEKIQADEKEPSAMVTGVVIVRRAFAEENPDAVHAFLKDYKASIEYVNTNVDEGAKLIGKYEIVTEDIAKKAIPACNITFVEGDELKQTLSGYLSVLLEENPAAVGGALPEDDFYY